MAEPVGLGQPKIYTREAVSWALFDFASTVFSMNVISRYTTLWIIKEKGGTDLTVAVAIIVSLVAASVVNVTLAPLSDAMGRRALFVRLFGLLCVVATALLGTNPGLGIGLALLALANFGNQSAGVFYTAMLPDVSTSRTLGRVSGLAVALGYVGSVIGLVVVERWREETASAAVVFLPTAVLFLVMAVPQFVFVRDTQQRGGVDLRAALRATWRDLALIARLVWQHRKLRWFMLAMLVYMDVHGTATMYMAVYAHYAIGFSDSEKVFLWLSEISLFLVVATVFAVAGAWAIGQAAERYDKVKLLLGVLGLWTVALTIVMITRVKWPFWVAGPMIGVAMGGIWVLSRALLVELGWPEHRTKLFTVFGLVGRAAGIVGPLVWGFTVRVAEPLGYGKYRVAVGTLLAMMMVAVWLVRKAMREKSA